MVEPQSLYVHQREITQIFPGGLLKGNNIAAAGKQATLCSTKAHMTRQQVLDLYFMDARSKLIDLAAFLDRVERAAGAADFRLAALEAAIAELSTPGAGRAPAVLMKLSDPTIDPIEKSPGKGACGAWPGTAAIK